MDDRQSVRAIVLNGDKVLAMKRNKFGSQYYTLIGGGVEADEDLEAALRRELREETGLEVGTVRQVFVEDGGAEYGLQYVYLCEYRGGDPQLNPASGEALSSAMGQNTYEPVWLPLAELAQVTFLSTSVRDALLEGVHNGFPETTQTLAWKGKSVAR